MNSARFTFSVRAFCFFAAISLLAMKALQIDSPVQAQQLAATYKHGSLSVTIPYDSVNEGSGKLTVEILDPEDHSLGRVERKVEIRKGRGWWQQTIVSVRTSAHTSPSPSCSAEHPSAPRIWHARHSAARTRRSRF